MLVIIVVSFAFFISNTYIADAKDRDFRLLKYDGSGAPQWGADGKTFDLTSDDYAKDIAIDGFGFIYVAGECQINRGGIDLYDTCVQKYDSSGNPQWNSGSGVGVRNSGFSDYANGIAIDTYGNIYVAGSYDGVSDFNIRVTKYDSNGTRLWATDITYDSGGQDYGSDIAVDSSNPTNAIYVSGLSAGVIRMMKYDLNKNTLWGTDGIVFNDTVNYALRAVGGIKVDSGNNLYVAVWVDVGFSGSSYDYAFLTLKYDSSGNAVSPWPKLYNPNVAYVAIEQAEKPRDLVLDTSSPNNVYIFGQTAGAMGALDYIVFGYNSSGTLLSPAPLAKYKGAVDSYDIGFGGAISSDNSYVYVTGETQSGSGDYDFATIKYNLSGVSQWGVYGITYDTSFVSGANDRDDGKKIAIGSGYIYVLGNSFTGDPNLTSSAPSLNSGALTPGQTVTFKGTVSNNGNHQAGTSNARFCINGTASNCYTSTTYRIGASDTATPALIAGATSPDLISNSWTVGAAGSYTAWLCADVGNAVVESNENASDNCSSWAFTVSSNTAPVANTATVNATEDTAQNFTLTGSDADGCGATFTFTIVTQPGSGSVSPTSGSAACSGGTLTTATLTHTPPANYNGSTSFTYKFNDSSLDSNTATVTVNVAAVNDAPTANNQSVSTNEDTPLAVTLTGADVDGCGGGQTFTFSVVTQPANGTVSPASGGAACSGGALSANVTYTPNLNFNGGNSFTFRFGDGTANSSNAIASITVTAVNDSPSITAGPSDNGSDGANPTNAGSNVTFTATATDADGDQYYLAVCRNPGITAGANSAPTCTGAGGSWAVSGATNSGIPASVSYPTFASDSESNVWYAYVCDRRASGAACSASSQGSGANGSPFKVNHAPSFTDVNDNPDPQVIGSNVTFTTVASDSDTDTAADTVKLFVCKNSAGVTSSGCGAGNDWCSATLIASNPSCSYVIQAADAGQTRNYYAYIFDYHNLSSASNPINKTFSGTSASTVPTVTSPTANSITATSAVLGATVTSDGGSALWEAGTCMGITSAPSSNCEPYGDDAGEILIIGIAFSETRTELSPGNPIASNTTYYYRGYAININGTGYTSGDTTFTTKPGQPYNLTFTNKTANSVTVNWEMTGTATSYKIERCEGSGCSTYNQIAPPPIVISTYYDDSGLNVGTIYRYRVRATGDGGDGDYSSPAEVTTNGGVNNKPKAVIDDGLPLAIVIGRPYTVGGHAEDLDLGETASYLWEEISCGGCGTFSASTSFTTTFSADEPGTYKLRFTVTDDGTPPKSDSALTPPTETRTLPKWKEVKP